MKEEARLGKGLAALINSQEISNESGAYDEKFSILKIEPNPYQPRMHIKPEDLIDLADSIREHGVIQPLIITKDEKSDKYFLIAGERRFRASQLAGLKTVPVVMKDSSPQEMLELALIENIQREDLNAVESAIAFKRLYEEFGLRHQDIADKIGKKRTTITNTMRLLTLPSEVQQAIRANKITEGHGRAILLAKTSAQMPIFREILKNSLSVRQAEEKARNAAMVKKSYTGGPKNPLFRKIEKELQEVIGRRVSITQRGDLGHIRVEFTNQGELDQIVGLLSKN